MSWQMLSALEAAVDANAQAVVDAWYRMKQADEGINAEEVQASLAKASLYYVIADARA